MHNLGWRDSWTPWAYEYTRSRATTYMIHMYYMCLLLCNNKHLQIHEGMQTLPQKKFLVPGISRSNQQLTISDSDSQGSPCTRVCAVVETKTYFDHAKPRCSYIKIWFYMKYYSFVMMNCCCCARCTTLLCFALSAVSMVLDSQLNASPFSILCACVYVNLCE